MLRELLLLLFFLPNTRKSRFHTAECRGVLQGIAHPEKSFLLPRAVVSLKRLCPLRPITRRAHGTCSSLSGSMDMGLQRGSFCLALL
jgi:hypothetical protein